jgi:hypothetical protein
MFTATLVAVSWHRPSMDFLSMRSRPASLGSRIYFTIVLCFELSVSKLSWTMQTSDNPFTGIHFFFLHAPPSPCASRTPDRLVHLPFQYTKHKHPFTALTFSPTFRHDHDRLHDNQRQHPTLSRSARTTRQPLPLLSPDPATHMARNRTRLRSSLAQTSNFQPAIPESIIRTRTRIHTHKHATTTVTITITTAIARGGERGCDGLDTDHGPYRSTGAGLAGPFPRAEDVRRNDGFGDVIGTHEYY